MTTAAQERETPATVRVPAGGVQAFLCSPACLTSLVVIGIALRLWAYASNTSLWLDEILLSRNILELSLGELLTRPLELDQVAPRGFLLVEWLAVTWFGPNELALRLFPFVCAVATVFVFRRLVERALVGLAVPLALMLFAVGLPFIKYGAEVKQYSFDAGAAVGLLYLAVELRAREPSTRRLVLSGAAGFVAIWFSQASVVVMGGLGAAFAIEWLIARDRRSARALLFTIPMWAVASMIGVVAGFRSMTPGTRQFMDAFWAQGFLPLPLHSTTQLRWIWVQTLSIFSDPWLLRYPWPALWVALALLGIVATWRRRRDLTLLLMGPFALALVAAIAQQYPFRGRLMFYLLPGVLVAAAAGAEWIRRVAGGLHSALGGALVATLAAGPVYSLIATPPPYEIEHHRRVLSYLQEHRKAGDVVYVFPLTRIGTLFYGPQYGLPPGEVVTAGCHTIDTRAYLHDVDRFRGTSRLWLVTSGARPFRVARPTLQKYLSTIGTRRDSLVLPSLTMVSVSLELYDLSDSTRLGAASADTFDAPPMPTDPRPGCRPWTRPDAPLRLRPD